MKISEWPAAVRPRERLLAEGPGVLSDAELLAILLRTGRPGQNALDVAQQLLCRFGSLHGLLSAAPQAACAAPGIGPARWALLLAARELARRAIGAELQQRDVLGSPGRVREFLGLWLRDRPAEAFVGLFLDNRNRLLAAEELFRGTLTQTAVYPREVVRRAMSLNAAAVIFAHNHPSGVAEASQADRTLTLALKAALAHLDVQVLDHLIVAGNHTLSFAERGML